MPKLIVLYPSPADAATFERRYRLEHAPMVMEKVPGLKKFVAAQVLGSPAGAALLINAWRSCTSIRSNRSNRPWPQREDKLLWLTPWRFRQVARPWS
jgi:hypothetical protein